MSKCARPLIGRVSLRHVPTAERIFALGTGPQEICRAPSTTATSSATTDARAATNHPTLAELFLQAAHSSPPSNLTMVRHPPPPPPPLPSNHPPAGPPHNNPSRLLRRAHPRPRRLRILPSSRRFPEIRRRQQLVRTVFLQLQHHHGRGLQHPQRRAGQNGQYRDGGCNRTV
jgi:hypothetical protein